MVRGIDEATYFSEVSRRERRDLFLDLVREAEPRRYLAGKREGGVFVAETVRQAEGWAYAELMERKKPTLASTLAALEGAAPESCSKRVEKARRALDVSLRRGKWRSTQMIGQPGSHRKSFSFQPPPDVDWVLLRPVETPW